METTQLRVIPVPQDWTIPQFRINQVLWNYGRQVIVKGLAIDDDLDMWKYYICDLDSKSFHWAYEYQLGTEEPRLTQNEDEHGE